MADDEDVPEEVWDMLETLGHSKNPTMTQAPAAVFQQPAAPKPAQPHGLPMWRPQHVQQLPLAPPSKPASLAHQLGGTIQFNRVPTLGLQQNSNQLQGMPRYTQYQQQQPWQHRQPWATSQYSTNRQAPQPLLRPQQVQPQHQQLPLASPGSVAPAAAAAAESSAHAPFNQVPPAAAALVDDTASVAPMQQGMQPTQALVPQLLQQELERLQTDLAAQAGMTTQLRHKLNLAEQEKLQLQQRMQHQQLPSNSITQHKTQELEKQVHSMKQQLVFMEDELSETKRRATYKESKVAEVEKQLKQLQDDLRRKEEQFLQLEHELEEEKHRTDRLAAAPATAAAAAASGAQSRPSQCVGNGLGFGYGTPGSSGGRKRRLNTTTSTPAAQAAAAAEGLLTSPHAASVGGLHNISGATQQQQQQQQLTTPLQQHRKHMQQLLGRPSIPQQQLQQQQQVVEQQQHQEVVKQDMFMDDVPGKPAAFQPPTTHVEAAHPPQQPAGSSPAQHLQQQDRQQQQQPEDRQKGLISLIDRLQQLQVAPSALSSLLWSSCKPALQQLLQPLSAQIPRLQVTTTSSSSSSTTTPAAAHQALQQAVSRVLTVLASVQQHLQAVASNASSSNVMALLLLLLQLTAVLIPPGGLGRSDAAAATAAAAGGGDLDRGVGLDQGFATQAAHTPSSSSSRWVLQQLDSPAAADSSRTLHLQDDQQQQCLVFRLLDHAEQYHVLPLPLAAAVLQLMQGLLLHDMSCLRVVAAAVGASQIPSSHLPLSDDRYSHNRNFSSSAIGPSAAAAGLGSRSDSKVPRSACAAAAGASSSNSSSGVVGFLQQGGAFSARSGRGSGSTPAAAAAAATSCWATTEAAVQSVLLLQPSSSSIMQPAAPAPTRRGQYDASDVAATDQKRTFFDLLADACRSHPRLQLPVITVLSALAGRLPAALQHLLLPATSDSNLVIQLLHSEGYSQRCQAVAVLQEMVLSHTVATAFAAALDSAASSTAALAGNIGQDTVMPDAPAAVNRKEAAPLQPSNRISYTQRSRAAAKAAVAAAFQEKPQQQQQQQGLPNPAAVTVGSPQSCNIPVQAVYDLLYGVLECISSGVGDLPRHPNCGSSSTDQWDLQCHMLSSSSSSCIAGPSCPGWGVFELQRRACAAVAETFQTKQEGLFAVMLDGQFTSGFGLSQRLLALVDAACSAPGGDPFSTATPTPPSSSLPAAARAAAVGNQACADALEVTRVLASGGYRNSNSNGGSITGGQCDWTECLERLRVVHEALLLLRALMAVGGPISDAATADICSNMTSIRMVQTTREKLNEWSDAITATAAAASTRTSMLCVYDTMAAGPPPPAAAAAAGLPLAPWSWAFSSSCGCRDKLSSNSSARVARPSGSVMSNVSDQLLRSQRPLLQDCLQEISSAASSVHRRAIQYLS